MSNISRFIYGKIGYYTSFHEKLSPPPIENHVGPVHTRNAFPANIVLVIKEYYFSDIEDRKFSASTIRQIKVQKVTTRKKPRIQVNVSPLQQVVNQGY